MMSNARFVERLVLRLVKALLANELPDLGNPPMTTCLSEVTARVRSSRVRNSRYKLKKTVGWPPA
jgi:hypothetical protein